MGPMDSRWYLFVPLSTLDGTISYHGPRTTGLGISAELVSPVGFEGVRVSLSLELGSDGISCFLFGGAALDDGEDLVPGHGLSLSMSFGWKALRSTHKSVQRAFG